jgi:selenide, water dikinase
MIAVPDTGGSMRAASGLVGQELVLIGGGHSHVEVLKRFGMKPVPGLRITLLARDVHTPYSGMLPGYIAGHYAYDQAHIDLRRLAHFAGARIYHTEACGLDLERRQVLCTNRPPVSFDLVSINTGSRPAASNIVGADEHGLPVKPIDQFLVRWEQLVVQLRLRAGGYTLAVVGGGAGGVELILSIRHRLRREMGERADLLRFHLITDTPHILPGFNARVRLKFERILRERDIEIHAGHRVIALEPGCLRCAEGRSVPVDAVLLVTQAAAAPWLAESGLATDEHGFVHVDDCLQSVSHPNVFAAGDVAAAQNHPRPKSGVFAVRQGPALASNLRRAAANKSLKPFVPQRQYLSLISTGDRYAVGSRGPWTVEGAWVWRLKDWIDRRWTRRYQELPRMRGPSSAAPPSASLSRAAQRDVGAGAMAMRCGGCGAKLGSGVLTRVMRRLNPAAHGLRDDIMVGLAAPDDAAVIVPPPGQALVQSVDYFRAFTEDAYRFGQIAANHALGDLYAMNARPHSALAIATVPYAREAEVEAQLYELMAGALEVLGEAGAILIGGHSSEGAELAFGLTVNGFAAPDRLLRKSGLQPGDQLVLTKALGTGTLLAADMRGQAQGRWIEAAIASMLISNRRAAECLAHFEASAATDVTGFGLLGHLVEMLSASGVVATLDLDSLPVLDGAVETVAAGAFSSLHPQNLHARREIDRQAIDELQTDPRYALLFDPQTAGGLLAGLPAARALECVEELRRLGYVGTAIVGECRARSDAQPSVVLRRGACTSEPPQYAGFSLRRNNKAPIGLSAAACGKPFGAK